MSAAEVALGKRRLMTACIAAQEHLVALGEPVTARNLIKALNVILDFDREALVAYLDHCGPSTRLRTEDLTRPTADVRSN
jgi:hypothetical protein